MAQHKRRVSKRVQIPERMALFLDGELTIDDLDDEEVERGQLRASDGSFRGRPASLVPREFTDAIRIRRQRIWNETLDSMVKDAWKAVKEIQNNPNPMPGDAARLAAARFTIERAQGKTPDNVNINAHVETWEKNMEQTIVSVDWTDVEDQKEVDE